MKVPGYPSNREADEQAQATARWREGACEDDAKPGDLMCVGGATRRFW